MNLTPRRQQILTLLAVYKAVTGPMIATHLEVPPRDANRELEWLRQNGLITGEPFGVGKQGKPPNLWRLRKAGALAAGIESFGSHYNRKPALDMLDHKSMELEITRQVAAAGWQLWPPEPLNPQEQRTARTRQATRLIETVRAIERYSIAHVYAQVQNNTRRLTPSELTRLETRVERVRSGEIDGFIPWRTNEYLAFVPADMRRTILLIVHPPRATRQWWNRRPTPNKPNIKGRLQLYSDLAKLMPGQIAAVFPTDSLLESYEAMIHNAAIVDDAPAILVGKPERIRHLIEAVDQSLQ